jgi:uncharacterized membrane protein YdjX (TVP38/TMEM64 family)
MKPPATKRRTRFAFNPRVIARGLALIVSLMALGWLLEQTHFGTAIDERWIDREVRDEGVAGELLFVATGALLVATGLPRQLISFLGGYAFGFGFGASLALAATVFGCMITFHYARWFGRGPVRRHFARRIRRIDEFLHDHPFSMTLLIRLLPVGGNFVTNLAAGVSSVRGPPFFAASALGYVPQTAVFALVGSGITIDPALRIGLAGVLFVCSTMLGVWLYRRYRHGKTLGREIERELTDVPARDHR